MRSGVVLFMLLVGARLAEADDPKFEYGKADEVKDVKAPEWHATMEAGVNFTTGSTENTNATGGIKVSRKAGDNKLAFEASGAYAKAGVPALKDMNGNGLVDNQSEITTLDTITAETLAARLRYDRFLTDFNSLYLAALGARDLPAGKKSVIGGQLGYSRRLAKTKLSETIAELGYDFSRETLITGSGISIHSARAFLGYKATMTAGADLDVALEALTNLNHENLPTGKDGDAFNDTRVNFKVAISAKIGANLAVQTALEAHYDNRPGPLAVKNLAPGFVPEASSLETLMKAQLIYTFTAAPKPPAPAADKK